MALSPLRVPFLGGTLDANGNGTFTQRVRNTHWASLTLAGRAQGSPTWDVMVGSDPALAGGPGGSLTVGPLLVEDQEKVTITVAGGTPKSLVYGTFWGLQADNAEDLTTFIGAPTISALSTTSPTPVPTVGSPPILLDQESGSNIFSFSFTNVNQTYRNLLITLALQSWTSSGQPFQMQFNTDTGLNYGWESVFAAAGTPGGSASGSVNNIRAAVTDTTLAVAQIRILNYASSNSRRGVLIQGGRANSAVAESNFGFWGNFTDPITRVFFSAAAGIGRIDAAMYGEP